MALGYVKEMRERESSARSGVEKPFIMNVQNAEEQIKFFKSRLLISYATLHPELTSEDIAALGAAGVKGQSQAHVIRDCFIDLGKVCLSPLVGLKEALATKSPQELAKMPIDGLASLVKNSFKGTVWATKGLVLTFAWLVTLPFPSKWSMIMAVRDATAAHWGAIFDRIAKMPINQVHLEIEALQTQVDEERSSLETAISKQIADGEGLTQDLVEKVATYQANVRLLVGLMELRENLSEKAYLLLPHLATGHGTNLRDHASALLSHLAVSVDMQSILDKQDQWAAISEKMKIDGSTPVIAYRALVDKKVLAFSDEHKQIEQEAADKLERSILWLQYATSRGDQSAPIYLATILCSYEDQAWSPGRAENTYQAARSLLREGITRGDWTRRRMAQDNMKELHLMRLEAAINNGRPPGEQSYAAHVLIEGLKFLSERDLKDQSRLFGVGVGKKIGLEASRAFLDKGLFDLAKMGSDEAAKALIDPVKAHIKKKQLDFHDIRVLSALAALGYPEATNLLRGDQMDSFIDSVVTAATKRQVTSGQFTSIALLRAYQHPRASGVMKSLIENFETSFKDSQNNQLKGRNIYLDSFLDLEGEAKDNSVKTLKINPGQKNLREFYETYIEPHPVEHKIPAFTEIENFSKIKGRVEAGKFTEEDVNVLLEGVKGGYKGAEGTLRSILDTIFREKRVMNDSLTETVAFAKWVLDVAVPAHFPDTSRVQFPRFDVTGLSTNAKVQEWRAEANFIERYQKLLNPSELAPLLTRSPSMSSVRTEAAIELGEDMPPVTFDQPRQVAPEEIINEPELHLDLDDFEQLAAPALQRRLSTTSSVDSLATASTPDRDSSDFDLFGGVALGNLPTQPGSTSQPIATAAASRSSIFQNLPRFSSLKFSPLQFWSNLTGGGKIDRKIENLVNEMLVADVDKVNQIKGYNIFGAVIESGEPLKVTDEDGVEKPISLGDLNAKDGSKVVKSILKAIIPETNPETQNYSIYIQREQNFIQLLRDIDSWIEELKGAYDKKAIEERAPDIFGSVLGELLFSGVNLSEDVGKDQLAEFIVKNRATFIGGGA